ncbi:MAG: hypothetical protein ABI857_03755 [Acidobacteriota bacterium]
MRKRVTISFLFIAASTLMFESCADRQTETDGERSIPTVCELSVTSSISDGAQITVKGKIGGYHELFLYSECSAENDRFLQLELSDDERKALVERSAPRRRDTADVYGEATIVGRYYRDAGKLYTYPLRQVEPGGMLKPVVVDKVTDAKIIAFQPQ